MKNHKDNEIEAGLQEYFEHKHPVFDEERGCKVGGPTLFDLREILAGEKEDFEDNTPLDEEGNLCVEWFWDIITGEMKKDMFRIIKTYHVNTITYDVIHIPGSNAEFIVDFEHKRNFPGFAKGAPRGIMSVESFGNKAIVIYGGFDDVTCMDSTGKQVGDTCVGIKKITYGKLDLLEFSSWVNPDYEVNDLRTKQSYLGSDGKRYKPKFQTLESTGIMSFEEITNTLKNVPVIEVFN